MKINLKDKKWLNAIALLFLSVSLSSCSATGYWWGRPDDYSTSFKSPWCAMLSIEGPFEIFNLSINYLYIMRGQFIDLME